MPLSGGAQFAGYTIIRPLGAGGMGEVYLAHHPRLARRDALKVLTAAAAEDGEYRERFDREADVVAGLWHPHIVGVHDRGEHDGKLWISMDYVEGTDAGELAAAHPQGLPAPRVAEIISAVADALDYAHDRHLLHRDVKPANIMIAHPGTPQQRILFADFGIARRDDDTSSLTATNMTVGTVSYAAPEQLMATKLDPALSKALSKDPAHRFDRCVDFARALSHRLGAVPAERAQPGPTDPTAPAPAAKAPASHRAASTPRPPWLRPAVLLPIVLAVLLVAALAFAAGEFLGVREAELTPPATHHAPK